MGSLAAERNVLEEGLTFIKNAKLEFASPVSEMYGALQRQYTQVRTIKLQGKAQDYVKKVLHDSKFFCILTKLITQAIIQSRNSKQQQTNVGRVHKWYTSNLHKLHFAEQPAFRRHDSDEEDDVIGRSVSVASPDVRQRAQSSPPVRKASGVSQVSTELVGESRQSRGGKSSPIRPKSVTWSETHERRVIDEEETATECDELWETETDVKSETTGTSLQSQRVGQQRSLDVVHSIAERRTPDYHLVDDDTYMDTVTDANTVRRHNSPVSRPFTPVVYEYIEEIQREVNKVQGHPSDLYPELFTPHIVKALIDENQELQPIQRLPASEKGRDLRQYSTEDFFHMADRYRPNSVKKFSSLQPRRERRPRPRTSLPITNSRLSMYTPEPKVLQMKDVVSLADYASAEISYEKESGIRAVFNRPKHAPPSLPQTQMEIEAPPTQPDSHTPAGTTPAIEHAPSPTPAQSLDSIVDWRGQVTPSCSESQQDMFRSHSYAKTSAKLSAQGRSAGGTRAGFRPKTAPVSLCSSRLTSEGKTLLLNTRVPQAASNTLSQVDKETTKALLNITNLKSSSRRHKSAGSAEVLGNYYMEYLSSAYAVPPTSIYEYDSYPYEHEPGPKSYQFMEDEGGDDDPPGPKNIEYFHIVHSIAPDMDRIRAQCKQDARALRLNTPASSIRTKEDSQASADGAQDTVNATGMLALLPKVSGETIQEEHGEITQEVHGEIAQEEHGEITQGDSMVNEPPTEKSAGDTEGFESARQRKSSTKSLVPSPMFQFTAYPTPSGGVLRARSPPGRPRSLISVKDNHSTGLERAVTAITFDPPFNPEHFDKAKQKPKSVGKLVTSTDKSASLAQPKRSAPSIPTLFNAYGSRSPRLGRSHPFSGEHDRSAHRQLNPQDYLKKVQGMRAEDVIVEAPGDQGAEELSAYLEVRPMSSHLELKTADLMVHNAIRFERPSLELAEEQQHSSPTFITEYKEERRANTPTSELARSGRPKSSMSTSLSRPDSSRPIPQYMKVEHWEKVDADTQRQREAAAAVSIQKIFRGYVHRKVYLNLRTDYRAEQENKQMSAIRIQRSWRGHKARLDSIYCKSAVKLETLQWAKEFKQTQQHAQYNREMRRESEGSLARKKERDQQEKLSMIGPHVEVYSAYHPPKTGATKKEIEQAASTIQKYVRGRQCRIYLQGIKEKAKDHASSWSEWVNYYKQFLRKILHRRGIDKPSIEINLDQMQKFMAQKKRYEGVFDRRAFGGELEEDEFVQFFRECDLMPATHEIEHAVDLVFKGKPRGKRTTLKKREVLDIVFEIYKPEGTGIINDRKSTWLHPIVDGEDAMKLLGSDLVEPTPLGPCIQLVANSMRERRERAEEERLRLLAEQTASNNSATTTGKANGVSPPVNGGPAIKQSSTSPSNSTDASPSARAAGSTATGEQHTQPPAQVKIFSNEPLVAPKKR